MNGRHMTYPVTSEVRAALARYPHIREALPGDLGHRSELEIIRVLGNSHYEHLDQLLDLIDRILPRNGLVAGKVLSAKDPFQFEQALAELFLFFSLNECMPGNVNAIKEKQGIKSPDFNVDWDGTEVCIEVYTPSDFTGNQTFEGKLLQQLKRLEVPFGYELAVKINAKNDPDKPTEALLYASHMPHESAIPAWSVDFQADVESWLGNAEVGETKNFAGPKNVVSIDITFQEKIDNPSAHQVEILYASKSTDTRLFFEVGDAETTARSSWGGKFEKKLRKRQAGDASLDKLRILIVNFALADTGWPDFICWPDVAQRIDETIRLLVDPDNPPYDVVVPANLGPKCGFGPAVILDESRRSEIERMLSDLGLDVPVDPEPGDDLGDLSPEENSQ